MKRITTASELKIGMTVRCVNSVVGGTGHLHFVNSPPYRGHSVGYSVDTINEHGAHDGFFLRDRGIDSDNPNRCYLEREFDIERDLRPGDIVKMRFGQRGDHRQEMGYEFLRYASSDRYGEEAVCLVTSHDETALSPAKCFELIRRPVAGCEPMLWGVRIMLVERSAGQAVARVGARHRSSGKAVAASVEGRQDATAAPGRRRICRD